MTTQEWIDRYLGYKVRDLVTGFEGVVSTIGFDLYGCIQVVVTPEVDKEGKQRDLAWFDVNRIELISKKPVMGQPNFANVTHAEWEKGPAEKPHNSRW